MSNIFEYDSNSTPLTEEESQSLLKGWITTKNDLNKAEHINIIEAEKWLLTSRQKEMLSEKFIKLLHKKMFGKVWSWAGKLRTTERNIGVAPYAISVELKKLFDDVNFWIENKTYPPIEICARFHHRLVFIHPFANGNGRHSRLMTDLVAKKLNQPPLNWGRGSSVKISELRKNYIDALREADMGKYSDLIKFLSP